MTTLLYPIVETLDLKFQQHEGLVASHLIQLSKENILVDVGPHSSFPQLQTALQAHGLEVRDITKILLTHIHLDHAGAAWAVGKQAQVYVHPRGAPHLINPEKLMASASMIYGEEMDLLWGKMKPITGEVLSTEDGVEMEMTNNLETDHPWSVRAHHTPGHANHYITWELTNKVSSFLFTGDVAGLKLDATSPFVQASIPPPDLHLDMWLTSLDKLIKIKAERLYLAHYGVVETKEKVEEHLKSLKEKLKNEFKWVKKYFQQNKKLITEDSVKKFKMAYREVVQRQYETAGLSIEEIKKYQQINPIDMSILGLIRYFKKFEKLES